MCIYTPIAVNGNDIEYYGEKIGVITVPYYQAEELNRAMLFDSHDVENARQEGYEAGESAGMKAGGEDMLSRVKDEIEQCLGDILDELPEDLQKKIALAINEAYDEAERKFAW